MKLLKRRPEELRHPGPGHGAAHHGLARVRRGVARRRALSFWEQLESYGAAGPGVPREQARDRTCPTTRPTSCARWCRRRPARASVPCSRFQGAVTDQVGRFLSRAMSEVTVDLRWRLLHRRAQAHEARREAARRRADHGRRAARQAGRRRVDHARPGTRRGPDGLAVIASSCMLADAAAAGVQAILPKEDGFRRRCSTCSRCRGVRRRRRRGGRADRRRRRGGDRATSGEARASGATSARAPRRRSASRSCASRSTTTATATTSSTTPRSPTPSTTS